jgi:phosphatidylserine/phosphatidylglycerophosphate/cardiolipin synthase-like enzyme
MYGGGLENVRTKSIIIIAVISFSVIPLTKASAGNPSSPIINEIMYNPIGNELDGEWIELFNVGGATNMKNWTITDRDGATYTFPEIEVQEGDFVLLYIKTGNMTSEPGKITLYMNRTWSMLNNGGDDLLLKDDLGTPVDYVNYGSGSGVDDPVPELNWTGSNKTVREGFSYALMPDGQDLDSDENWMENSPSPGTPNSVDEGYGILITEVYYSAHRDNEYMVLHNPFDEGFDLSGWTITDLEGAAFFPDHSIIGPNDEIAIAENSTSFHEDTMTEADYRFAEGNATPMPVQGVFKLKNDGDELILKNRAGRVIDVFSYGSSNYSEEGWSGDGAEPLPKGKVAKRVMSDDTYMDTNRSADWNSLRKYGLGQSSFQARTFNGLSNITAFASPDSAYDVVSEVLDNASANIVLSLYKLTSLMLADRLIDALGRGVNVEILLEGGPVSGIEDDQKYIMREIADNGGQIRLMVHDSSAKVYERYRYLHEKYAVIDGHTSIVTSENWGLSGIPENSSYGNRGWGISVENKELADELLNVFLEDSNISRRDITSYSLEKYPVAPGYASGGVAPSGDYEPQFESVRSIGHHPITTVLSPDTSLDESTVIGLIRSARSSILVEQFYIVPDWKGGITNPYFDEVIEGARRGLEVKVILDDSDYNTEPGKVDNDDVVELLTEIAKSEGLDLEARLFDSRAHGVLKLHNKGVIVDGYKVLVSSINWNENSVTGNRELGLIVESEEIGGYFTEIFLYDWKNDVTDPIARGCRGRSVLVGQKLTFDGSDSYDENPLEYVWDFDGDGVADSGDAIAKFAYEIPGTYIVQLNVTDSSGNYNITRCLVEVSSSEKDGSSGIWTWLFYGSLTATCLIALFFARKLSGRKKKLYK